MTRLSFNYLLDIYDDTTINEKQIKVNKYRVECIFFNTYTFGLFANTKMTQSY